MDNAANVTPGSAQPQKKSSWWKWLLGCGCGCLLLLVGAAVIGFFFFGWSVTKFSTTFQDELDRQRAKEAQKEDDTK